MAHANLVSELVRPVLCSDEWVIKLVLPFIIVDQRLLSLSLLAKKVHLVDGIFLLTIFDLLIFAAIFDGLI